MSSAKVRVAALALATIASVTTPVLLVGAGTAAAAPVADPAAIVNPRLGTSHDGNTFPGADAPFGMVQWSPDTPSLADGGGYTYSDTTITGFSLTHLSGPGCDATGDVPILPTVGAVANTASISYSHSNETASAGAYAVTLGNGVKTELTATTRSGMARFTFPATGQANLLFKLTGAMTGTTNPSFTAVSNTEVSGAVTAGGFCGSAYHYTLYYDVVFDRAFSANSFSNGLGSVTFDASANQVVQAKVGISFVSAAGAAGNRAAENAGWDFAGTRTATHNAWNTLLNKIQISGGTTDSQTVFYTSLYHALLHPNVVSDSNGQYRGFDNAVHTVTAGHQAQYGNYSGWDIYRAQAQLSALVAPQQMSDSAQSMVNDYAQGGTLPKWSFYNGETYVMVGDPADGIIAGYYAFGARNFDTAAAKDAMVHQATVTNGARPGLTYLAGLGYLPSDGSYGCCNFYGPVSTLLEYNTADFAVGAFAGALGDTTTRDQFYNRAQDWRNMFNAGSGFMQPKLANGAWKAGFNPASGDDFVEGTSWQYTGMVPFNVRGLADAKGGNAAMVSYLDSVLGAFNGSGGTHADLGNEPSVELPWEYDYVGQPWKTQAVVRQVQNQLWPNNPAAWGVGNDDLGTMSAWYVFSALGFFPETPGTSDLALGSPLFTQAIVHLGGGGTITINAPAAATNAPYVQSLKLNGSAWNNAYLPASFALNGGTLDFVLGTTANTSWATAASSAPPSYNGNGGSQPPTNPGGATGPITSAIAGKCVDVDHSGTADGTKVQLWSCNGSLAQAWTPVNGTLQAFGKCLDVSNSGTANGTLVQLWTCNGSGAQQWAYDGGTGALRNPQSGRCLDDPGSSTTDGTQLQIYDCNGTSAQHWTVPHAPTGQIGSAIAGKCADVNGAATANGTKIQIWSCNTSAAQVWTLPGDGTLRALGKCMDVSNSGTANGSLVQLWDCNSSGAQQWLYVAGTGALRNPQSGRCLDVPKSSTTDGTQLQIYDCNGTNAQHWNLPT
ncbi:lectin [Dactylosporangium sp. NPDC051485]|uniref:lectin n=1 Tax=Dactylosporangium sp. NPDC051485 TaxID=3154846 RepID=UPI0034249373